MAHGGAMMTIPYQIVRAAQNSAWHTINGLRRCESNPARLFFGEERGSHNENI